MAIDLAKTAKDRQIKYFFISFVDLFGVLRAHSCVNTNWGSRRISGDPRSRAERKRRVAEPAVIA